MSQPRSTSTCRRRQSRCDRLVCLGAGEPLWAGAGCDGCRAPATDRWAWLPQVLHGSLPLGKFVITKQLTKSLEQYPDAKNQPHVQVALRRRQAGKRDGVMAVRSD